MLVEEAVVGAVFAISFIGWLGLWVWPVAAACAWLWARGGVSMKWIRRIGCPVVVGVALGLVTGNWIASLIWMPIAWANLSVGYGSPSTQPPDAGSVLGRFVYRLCHQNEHVTAWITRSLIIGCCALEYWILVQVTR